jgi:excisionase family DNA binding protein
VFDKLPDLLTAEEACEFLRITPLTLYTYIKQGKLPAFRVGKRYRITKESIVAFLQGPAPDSGTEAPEAEPEEKAPDEKRKKPERAPDETKDKIEELFGKKGG